MTKVLLTNESHLVSGYGAIAPNPTYGYWRLRTYV